MDYLQRTTASMLGFAIGDALGATTEFMSPGDIRQEYGLHSEIIGGGWLELDPGEVTDDTEMTLCVARSLVECRGFNMKDIADRFVDWYNSDPIDIGGTCRAGIHRYIRSGRPEAAYDELSAGNGSVMRELPLILLYSHDREFMFNAVVSQSRLTHNNKESDEGCRCYADMVSSALEGASKEELQKVLENYPLFAAERYDGDSNGYIVSTLRTVFHFFFPTDSLEEYVIAVVNCGQDADTCGAMAGGLAGAFWGKDAIPSRWLEALDRNVYHEMVTLAESMEVLKGEL